MPPFSLGAGDQAQVLMLGQEALYTPSPLLSSYLRHFSPLGCDIRRAEAGREHLELGEMTEARSPRGLSCDFTGPGHEGDTAWQLWDSSLSHMLPERLSRWFCWPLPAPLDKWSLIIYNSTLQPWLNPPERIL